MCTAGTPQGEADDPAGAAAPDRARGADGRAYGALDLGTNNCRLLVARAAADGFRVVDSFSRIVRLGEGLEFGGRLVEPAMARTLDALDICAEKLAKAGVVRLRAVATEACRRAANGPEFLERARARTGIAFETIDCATEADLALAGCTPLFADAGAAEGLLFDIGGGSTQLVWADLSGPLPRRVASVSVPHGVVTLTDRVGGPDMSEGCYAEIRSLVARDMRAFLAGRASPRAAMVGTSGTVTTLAAVRLRLPRYERRRVDGVRLNYADIAEAIAEVRGLDHAGRVAHPCIGPERAASVLAGCAILEAICAAAPAGTLRVADRGLREGILMQLMAADRAGA